MGAADSDWTENPPVWAPAASPEDNVAKASRVDTLCRIIAPLLYRCSTPENVTEPPSSGLTCSAAAPKDAEANASYQDRNSKNNGTDEQEYPRNGRKQQNRKVCEYVKKTEKNSDSDIDDRCHMAFPCSSEPGQVVLHLPRNSVPQRLPGEKHQGTSQLRSPFTDETVPKVPRSAITRKTGTTQRRCYAESS